MNANCDAKICDFGLSRTDVGSNFKTLNKLRGTYTYAGLPFPIRSLSMSRVLRMFTFCFFLVAVVCFFFLHLRS